MYTRRMLHTVAAALTSHYRVDYTSLWINLYRLRATWS
jgi:hypothetical protein